MAVVEEERGEVGLVEGAAMGEDASQSICILISPLTLNSNNTITIATITTTITIVIIVVIRGGGGGVHVLAVVEQLGPLGHLGVPR